MHLSVMYVQGRRSVISEVRGTEYVLVCGWLVCISGVSETLTGIFSDRDTGSRRSGFSGIAKATGNEHHVRMLIDCDSKEGE